MKSRNRTISQICHDFDMRIAWDGTWFYQSTPIKGLEIIGLFVQAPHGTHRIYWPKNPFERNWITVGGAPFVIALCGSTP